MQDGNVVFSSMEDLAMMTHYEDMLQQLKGQSVCLLLDRDNSAINKVACDYLNMSQEEREAYRAQLREEMERKAAQEKQQAEAKRTALWTKTRMQITGVTRRRIPEKMKAVRRLTRKPVLKQATGSRSLKHRN